MTPDIEIFLMKAMIFHQAGLLEMKVCCSGRSFDLDPWLKPKLPKASKGFKKRVRLFGKQRTQVFQHLLRFFCCHYFDFLQHVTIH